MPEAGSADMLHRAASSHPKLELKAARLILKKLGLDAVMAQPFPNYMIFSKDRRFEVRGDRLAETTIRSIKTATDGGFQITESLGERSLLFSRRHSFTLNVVDPTTIEITEGKIVTQFFKCSSSPSLWPISLGL